MKRTSRIASLVLLLIPFIAPTMQSAQAGCRDYPESLIPRCIAENLAEEAARAQNYQAEQANRQLEAERAAQANAEKNAQDQRDVAAADAKLPEDDCARSTNRYLQSCIDAQTAKAAAENAALLDESMDSDKIKPILGADGEVLVAALLKSKSLSAYDIARTLANSNLSDEDKMVLSKYAQKLNTVKNIQNKGSFKLPVSDLLSEEFVSNTPKICKVVEGLVKNLKSGTCQLTLKFLTDTGYEVQTTKKFIIKK